MKTLLNLAFLFSTFLFHSCESQNVVGEIQNGITLGSNFGFCFGPCYQTMTVHNDGTKVTFIVKYRDGAELKTETFEDKISDARLSTIIDEENFDLIYSLKEVYGCPDCADGGSEWIEIISSSNQKETKRVTFEYGNPPKEIENLVSLLRSKKDELSSKYVRIEN